MDEWAGAARETGQASEESVRNPQFFYDESQIMVQSSYKSLIYGDIAGMVTEEISQVGLIAYLMEKNPT